MRLFILFAIVMLSFASAMSQRRIPLKDYRRAAISVKGNKIFVWVAERDTTRAASEQDGKLRDGFMFINASDFKQNEGMIFIMPNVDYQAFWMRNTPTPLDIAFLKTDGKILNVLTMKPYDESRYASSAPAKYAVEVHAGYFQKKGIRPGDRFDLSGLTKSKVVKRRRAAQSAPQH